jgi:hypothetical protein
MALPLSRPSRADRVCGKQALAAARSKTGWDTQEEQRRRQAEEERRREEAEYALRKQQLHAQARPTSEHLEVGFQQGTFKRDFNKAVIQKGFEEGPPPWEEG